MSVRHLTTVALALVFSLGSVLGQEPPEVVNSDSIANWTAPPFWTPPGAIQVERPRRESALHPEALEVLPSGPLPLIAVAPCRLLDTRNNLNPLGGGGPFAINETRTYTLPGACGLPSGMGAVSLNVTATNTGAGAFGHIKVWPADGTEPNVSTLNYPGAGATVANAAIVPLSSSGQMKVKSGNAGADVILDVNGYYAPISIVNTINGLSGAVTLSAGTNVTITPSGNNLTIASTGGGGGSAWSLTGNSGTTAGTNFLGTTDNQPLELKVNGQRALRIEPGLRPNVIGGWSGNNVTAGKIGATIGGGGSISSENVVTDDFGTVSGGVINHAGFYGTVGGGDFNFASGNYAVIPGGLENNAPGDNTFAAGTHAQALHTGAFVWADSTDATTTSTGQNQFMVRATGGIVLLRTGSAPHATGAALQVEHGGTNGEAAWLYTTNSGTTADVVRALKFPSATNNFFRCSNYDGTTVTNLCHIDSSGTYHAGSDFAEALPAHGGKTGLEPGDVVVVSRDLPGAVEKSTRRCDTRAIGVYSTRPGFVGADKNGETRVDPGDIPVAIMGIVPTKVTAENGPIGPGDLLTTASRPGYAMKATAVSVAGVDIYAPGTIIGKAIEPLRGETGVIKVLVTLR